MSTTSQPVVASAVGGIQDQLRDGEDGILLGDPTNLSAFAAALNLDRHPCRRIEDVSGEPEIARQVVNEGTKPDTLHDAAHT